MLGDVKQLKNMMLDMQKDMHTAIPGKIVSVDAGKNTCSVQPYGKYKKSDGSYIDYPQLDDVPLCLMQGKGQKVSITYPIKSGDGCQLIFSEQQLDHWDDDQDPKTELRFDLSNAMAIPGLCSSSNGKFQDACDNDAIIIDAEDTTITCKKDEIELKKEDTSVKVEESKITCDVSGTTITIENGKVTIKGNLKVEGSIVSTGVVYAAVDAQVPTHSLTAQPIPGAFPPPFV